MSPLILASASKSRARVLSAAGITFEAIAADVDEGAIKDALKKRGMSVEACAEELALAKAKRISEQWPDAVVIGADQMLACDGAWFDKPADLEGARHHLRRLSGRTHTLPTAIVALRGEKKLWTHIAAPRLTMRPLTEEFITTYLARAGTDVCSSVGAYQLEEIGRAHV